MRNRIIITTIGMLTALVLAFTPVLASASVLMVPTTTPMPWHLATSTSSRTMVPDYTARQNKEFIRKVTVGELRGTVGVNHFHHLSDYQAECMVKLAYRESSWDNLASNGSCWGLFQLSTSKVRNSDGSWKPWQYPKWNTDKALHYIFARYGSPSKALSHSLYYGWY